MVREHRAVPRATVIALFVAGGLSACAPLGTEAIFPPSGAGGDSTVSYGTVIGARPMDLRAGRPGAVPVAGGDWRSSLLAGLGGGFAGRSAPAATMPAGAVEFLVREDGGRDLATVQGNGDGIAVGERVAIIRGDRTRLARTAGAAPRG